MTAQEAYQQYLQEQRQGLHIKTRRAGQSVSQGLIGMIDSEEAKVSTFKELTAKDIMEMDVEGQYYGYNDPRNIPPPKKRTYKLKYNRDRSTDITVE